jgi:hypothetical protein
VLEDLKKSLLKILRHLFLRKIETLKEKKEKVLLEIEKKKEKVLRFPSLPSFPKINLGKNLILVLLLVLVLLGGSFLFEMERKKEIKEARRILDQVQSTIIWAKNALIYKDTQKANRLYQEAWRKLDQLPVDFILAKEAQSLKKEIEMELAPLNQMEIIEEPNLILDFEGKDFLPQKILVLGQNLYFFNPFRTDLFSDGKNPRLIKTQQKFDLGLVSDSWILFFSLPNLIFPFDQEKFQEAAILELPLAELKFSDFCAYQSNLYFLDSTRGEIIRYSPFLIGEELHTPQFWLNPKTKKPRGAKSMAVDGSIWILTKENSIDRYHGGYFKETLKLNFFPPLKQPSKIFTQSHLPHLYLLEPAQNRVLILTKHGDIVKQFQSKKFDELKDFAISQDGKTIFLLSGLKVYQINL